MSDADFPQLIADNDRIALVDGERQFSFHEVDSYASRFDEISTRHGGNTLVCRTYRS
jgi:hypothetical protein